MSKSDELMIKMTEMINKIRAKNPDFKIMTAVQPTRESGPTPRLNFGKPDFDILIIDHVNLIK